ncbi:uncharacterized protein [Spinacia oleracea]|uniref:Endonuclease/exonuclease/phosphatase domain-containing protein n=1 Tax=Spinacia oleracea TaxID=3562 RepID=A0ABM3RIL3_SPIOL|nr:uncharacterized protein LOC130469936 [Spinacia oleracea]
MGGNSTKIRGLNKFVEWKEEHNLFEIDFSGPRFTWSNGRKGNDRILERLDKAYANSCWQNIFPQAYLIHGAIAISNHAPIILMTEPQKKKVKRNYKVEAWSLEYKQCEILAKEKWSKRVNGSPMYQCARKIQYCREGLKKWSLDKRKEWQGKWDIFEKDLIEAQLIMEDTGNDEKFEQIKARMEEYSGNMANYWKQQEKIKWNCEGDACSRYFFNFVKSRKARNKIEGVKDMEGNWITYEGEIALMFNNISKKSSTLS